MNSLGKCLLLSGSLSMVLLGLGCQRPQIDSGENSKVQIQVPTAAAFALQKGKSHSLSDNSIEYEKLCFAVQVRGDGISAPASVGQCSWQKGIAVGSVAPGETLSIEVPMGADRTFEVIGFLRASTSEVCGPVLAEMPADKLAKTYLLGSTAGVSNFQAEMTVNIQIALPAASANLGTTLNMPAVCTATTAPPPTPVAEIENLETPRSANFMARGHQQVLSSGISFKAKSQIIGFGADNKPSSANYEVH